MLGKRRQIREILLGITLITGCLVMACEGAASAGVRAGFLYKLSDFTGFIPYTTPRLVLDNFRNEVYVLFQNNVRVFNENGMEVYSFGDDLQIGHMVDLVIDREGDIIILAFDGTQYRIVRCNYRGESIADHEFTDLLEKFSDFRPSRVVYHNDDLYFISLMGYKVVVTDGNARYKNGYDLKEILQFTDKDVTENEIIGFNVASDSSILLTVPAMFKVYRVSPDHQVTYFGDPGGPPGKFGIIAGITTDSKGNYLIADQLKSIVHIFDKDNKYVTEFGHIGTAPGSLFRPWEVDVNSKNQVFVSQSRFMGISVFLLEYD